MELRDIVQLRQSLQRGRVTRLFSSGGDGILVPILSGYTLRMPTADTAAWSGVNDQGKPVEIPRPAHAVRVWDAELRMYAAYDPQLNGAPVSPADIDAWFVGRVQRLKRSYGGPFLDALVTSTHYTPPVNDGGGCSFEGTFSSRWTDLVVSTLSDWSPSEYAPGFSVSGLLWPGRHHDHRSARGSSRCALTHRLWLVGVALAGVGGYARREALQQWLNDAIELAVGGTGALHEFLDRSGAVEVGSDEDVESESDDDESDESDGDESDDEDDDEDEEVCL